MSHVKSVAKAARILRCFDAAAGALTVRDIAERTGLPRSTCHAICSTLVAEDMLAVRSTGGYVLGGEMMVMGAHVVARSGLVDAAAPVMQALAASSGGEVHLGQLDDQGCIVYLPRVRSHQRLQARNWFGLRVAAHRTGCGRAALSVLEPERAREMTLAQGLTAESAERLLDDLECARRTGFVVTTSYQAGLGSVAAPVVAPGGRIVAALSVVDRRETLTHARVARLGSVVRDAAGAVTRQFVAPRPWTGTVRRVRTGVEARPGSSRRTATVAP